ncbi:MAG: alkaline phosphatase family protein, partial [Planctomycetes bacterium]|nr:alkaline phosphatase family protein [Planctomycetota bacterium]
MEMLEYALDHFERDGGLLFFYTGSLDLRCHMLWHCVDDQHPHQEPSGVVSSVPQEYAEKAEHFGLGEHLGMSYAEQINRVYRQVDDLLGYLLDRHEAQWPDAEFMVMSDHGFAPMRRVMNVNDWLVQEGYLVLKEGEASGSIGAYGTHEDGSIDWDSSPVDWEKTRAFSVGFNGVILNRVGREPRGMVQPDQAPALLAEMSVKLLKLQDQGNQVLTRVLPASEVYEGDQLEWAPDLQLGFNVGFGASDPSAEGQVTGDAIIVDNDSRWSGSHLMDPELVRGTIATLRPHTLPADPALEDITATVYNLFDVTPPAGMDGKPLF